MLRDMVNKKITEFRNCHERISEIGTEKLLQQVMESNEKFGWAIHGNPPFILKLDNIRSVVIDENGKGHLLSPFVPGVEQWIDTSEMKAVYSTPLLGYGVLVFEPAMNMEYLPVIDSYEELEPTSYLESIEEIVSAELRKKMKQAAPEAEDADVSTNIELINGAMIDMYMEQVKKFEQAGVKSPDSLLNYVKNIQISHTND